MKGYFFSFLGFRVVLAVIGALLCSSMFAQDVYNVRFRQEGNKVIIKYSLSSKSGVSIFVSTDGGSSFGDALKKVKGDVGTNVSAGENTIIWSPMEEMAEIKGDDIVFLITTTAKTERFSNKVIFNNYLGGVNLLGNIGGGLGVNVGSVRNIGWYADVFIGIGTGMRPLYNYYETGIDAFTAENQVSFLAGPVFRTGENSALSLGLGITFPDLTGGASLGVGYNIFIKSFSLTAQVSTINFQRLELRLGIGWCLRR